MFSNNIFGVQGSLFGSSPRSLLRASPVERVNLDVYISIYTSIYTWLNFTPPSFSVERVSRTCKSGRVYSNGYIFKRLYFQRLYFQTAIFPTTIFLVYINHPYHLSSSTCSCDFSSHSNISLSSLTQHNEHILLGHEFFVIFIW